MNMDMNIFHIYFTTKMGIYLFIAVKVNSRKQKSIVTNLKIQIRDHFK